DVEDVLAPAFGSPNSIVRSLNQLEFSSVAETQAIEAVGLGTADVARGWATRRICIFVMGNQRPPMFVASPLDRLAYGFAGERHRSGDSANAGGLEREAHQQEATDHSTDQRPIHRARHRVDLGRQIAQRI